MIIFADFDGTIFTHGDDLTVQKNLIALRNWRAAGNKFCITTGRSIRSLIRQLPEIQEICDYYIVDSGSIILDHDQNPLKVFCFDPAIVTTIIDFSKSLSEVPTMVYYTHDSEDENVKTEGITKLRYWFQNPELLNPVRDELRKDFPVLAFSQIALDDSKGKGFVEIIPRELGKSNAIKYLQQLVSISPQDIITVGDGLNDYDMVRDFAGYAIKNSELANFAPSLKTAESVAEMISQIQ